MGCFRNSTIVGSMVYRNTPKSIIERDLAAMTENPEKMTSWWTKQILNILLTNDKAFKEIISFETNEMHTLNKNQKQIFWKDGKGFSKEIRASVMVCYIYYLLYKYTEYKGRTESVKSLERFSCL